MNRRNALKRIGTLLALGSLGGCLDRSAAGGSGPTTTEETTARDETTSATTRTMPEFEPYSDEPFAEVKVGDRGAVFDPERKRPHGIRVWNDADESRTLGVRVESNADNGPTLDREWDAPADGFLTVRLVEPADYAVTVSLDGATVAEFDVGRTSFDCNSSGTTVQVTPDGDARWATHSTMAGCGLTVYQESFAVTDRGCGSTNDASVAFGEERLTVSGRLAVPNPCHGAELAAAEVDGDTLRVTVEATEPGDDVGGCVQCLGEVAYEAAFTGGTPRRVVVVHRRGDERTEVASATCGECAGGTAVPADTTSATGGGSEPTGVAATTDAGRPDATSTDAETRTDR